MEEEEEEGERILQCRLSAVVVQLVGKHWALFRKIMLLDLSLFFII